MMAAKTEPYSVDLLKLVEVALQDEAAIPTLEQFLVQNSNLPGPRMNLALVAAFAEIIGQIVTTPTPPVEKLEALLDSWAALSLESAPINQPREILPAVAVMSYGYVAVARPDWWEDEVGKLQQAASNPRWRVREIVATALQRMLKADWVRSYKVLVSWLETDDPLVVRAVVAAIAEPPLLTDELRGAAALAIQVEALKWFEKIPAKRRREENIQVLRKALGYTLSVAIAASPEPGMKYLNELAGLPDQDIQWIVRENLKKNRLTRFL